MPLRNTKLFQSPLTIASAVLAIHIGVATAADSTGDISQQVRDFLTASTVTHLASQPGSHEGKATSPIVDSQQFVKQLLLGTTASRARGAEMIEHSEVRESPGITDPNERPLARGDTQAAVRRTLLGQHLASEAS